MTDSVVVSLLSVLLISNCFVSCWCYDSVDYEIFDLVEEINKNFYDILGINSKASTSDIKRAYRRLAVKYHPDKNTEEGAEDFFRQIAAIYDVLKDDDKRQRYDLVLQTGLPDWKQPVFYYRRVRKLGLVELAVILTLILTIGHFLVMWASYFERRYVVEELLRSRQKKERKIRGRNKAQALEEKELELEVELEEQLSVIPRPKLSQLLPIRLIRWTWLALVYVVYTPLRWQEWYRLMEKQRRLEQLEKEEEERRREELNRLHEASKNRKRVNLAELRAEMMSQLSHDKPVVYSAAPDDLNQTDEPSHQMQQRRVAGEWSDEEISLLAKAVVKYPSGIPQRWQKIADMLQRPIKEVTEMANNLKQGYSRPIDIKAQGITGAVDEVIGQKGANKHNDVSQTLTQDNEEYLVSSAVISAGNAAVRRRKRHHQVDVAAEKRVSHVKVTSEENGTALRDSVQMRMQSQSANESQAIIKVNAHSMASSASRALWSQEQQKLLEQALIRYPRGTTNRWDVIAECVPGKTKEDCMIRFKYLADIVRKKKEQQAQ